jgi:hypothetical protein
LQRTSLSHGTLSCPSYLGVLFSPYWLCFDLYPFL